MTTIAAAALAIARDFEFGGRKLKIRPLTYADFARFSMWLETRAANGLDRLVSQGAAGQKSGEAAILTAIAAGDFEPGGEVFAKATRSEAGNRYLLELSLEVPAGEDAPTPEEASWAVFADEAAFAQATKLVGQVNDDPKAKALRRKSAGTTP